MIDWNLIGTNILGGLACFAAGGTLGYVVKALGGVSGVVRDVAVLKADVSNLKVQSPLVVQTPQVSPAVVATTVAATPVA